MIDPKIKAIGFDMDNTLLKSNLDYEELRMSISKTVAGLGVDPRKFSSGGIEFVKDVSEELGRMGKSMSVPDILKLISKDMCKIEMATAKETVPIEGTKELLSELRSKGYRLGVLSNGFREYVEYSMGKFGLLKYFDIIICHDDLPFGTQKPNPEATKRLAEALGVKCEELLYIGDSVGDYQSAHAAGAEFIAVTTGNTSEEGWKAVSEYITVIDDITKLV